MRNREQQMIDAGNLAAARRVLAESNADASDWECLREHWLALGVTLGALMAGAISEFIWGIWTS